MTNTLAVIKVGGDILADQAQLSGLVSNVAQATQAGLRVVLLHGGGPQISAQQQKLGMQANKVGGRRITSAEDLRVVKQIVCGELNVNLVTALHAAGVNGFGCHGASGRLISAVKRPPRVVQGSDGKAIDFGEVGDVTAINTTLLNQLLDADQVPVIASLGSTDDGRALNINADTTVVNIARSMSANLLVLVTRVGAIFEDLNDPNSRIPSINSRQAQHYIENRIISEGMIPKVQEALDLVDNSACEAIVTNLVTEGTLLNIAGGSKEFGTRFERL